LLLQLLLPVAFAFQHLLNFLHFSASGSLLRGSFRRARRPQRYYLFRLFHRAGFPLVNKTFPDSAEKEQLTSAHRKLKEQGMQAELRHARELKEAKAATEAKLDETLKEYTDSTAGLRKELEEEAAARKAAQDKIAQLTADQADYNKMVMQIDALACSK
jgi:hypothetical protein